MKKFLTAFLAIAMLFSLAVCGTAGAAGLKTGGGELPAETVGTYKLTGMSGEDGVSEDELSAMETLGLTATLTLAPDGTGVLDIFGETTDVTWDESSLTAEGESIGYTLTDGVLVLSDDDLSLTFTKTSDEVEAPAAAEGGAVAEGVFAEGDIAGDYHVAIVGAEAFKDTDDKDAVRFYYTFTNNSDEITSAWWELSYEAEQEGYELVSTYASWDDDAPEYGNEDLEVMPGCTILCEEEFNFKPTGGELTFTLSDYGDDPVTATFSDAANLPGRPEVWTPEIIEDPQTFADYELTGSSDNLTVTFTDAETDTYEGVDFIRIYMDVTNNTDEAESAMWLTNLTAFQDGVELSTREYIESNDTDDAYWDDIEPGETLHVSYTWNLRTGSPVEITVKDYVDYSSDVLAAATVTID